MNRYFKLSGLVLFTVGMIVWIVSITLSQFTLTNETMELQGKGEKFELLQKATSNMTGKLYKSNIKFIADLKKAFDEVNVEIKNKYAITKDEVAALVAQADEKGTIAYSEDYIKNSALDSIKKKGLYNYTTWMYGKTYDSRSELEKALQNTVVNFNNNIKYQLGFDDYTEKTLLFSITKTSSQGVLTGNSNWWLFLSIGLIIIGGIIYFFALYGNVPAGIKNNQIFMHAVTSKGWLGVILGTFLILFYIGLYFYPEYMTSWVILVDPISKALNGGPASHWFFYGFLYTLAIAVMGIRMLLKYKGNRYQIIRTISVIFFQSAFAFIIPEILVALNKPGYDFKNIWPLDYDFFYSYNLNELINSGALGWFMLVWGILLIIIAVPVITYFYGKRWYCSWVCGCGGLAETFGDPFRQLSDKSLKAWKIERWMVHSVLVFAFINTAFVLYAYFTGSASVLGIQSGAIRQAYGFLISSIFAGVVGTGFYPLMGNRVWCRFGCPLAAYLGLVQRFKSRFRITTNGGQCISCGNCSTYCEMGIDVRWYAQRGQNIVRSSCVGCGICSAVCPRGVLRLENGPEHNRMDNPHLVGNEGVNVNSIT